MSYCKRCRGLTLYWTPTSGNRRHCQWGPCGPARLSGQPNRPNPINNREKEGQTVITDQQATLHSVAEVSADEAILAMIEPIETELESWLDQPLGKVNGDMNY